MIVLDEAITLQDKIDLVGVCEAETVFISVMPPYALRQPRDLCRELRAHFPHLEIIVVFCGHAFRPRARRCC